MPATIRLQRVGRKKQASFRIVVTDTAESRSGPALETLGFYNPRTEPSVVRLDAAAALTWLREGAQPTDTVRSIFRKTGLWERFAAGETPESLEEAVVTLGPPPGERKTSSRAKSAAEAEDRKAAEAEAKPKAKKAEPEAEAEQPEPEAEQPEPEAEETGTELEAEGEPPAADEPAAEEEAPAEPEAEAEQAAEAEAEVESEAEAEQPEPEAEEAEETEPEAEETGTELEA
ncbi:MAG: 30S ribosomal protein S16, partial [Gemmatimonadota bacterium]